MNSLKINVCAKEYPYEKTHNPEIAWGEIRITINDFQDKILKDLCCWEWDTKQMFDWLICNKGYILNENLSIHNFLLQNNDSIAKRFRIFIN